MFTRTDAGLNYVRPYENTTDFANAVDIRTAISLATVEIDRAEIAVRKLDGGAQP
jgi:hypothetical protein